MRRNTSGIESRSPPFLPVRARGAGWQLAAKGRLGGCVGVLNRKLAEATATFAGIKDYANSGVEERPILAMVAYDGDDARFHSRTGAFADDPD